MIGTERLRLRAWQNDDVAAHNALAADPRVAATLGSVPTLAQSAGMAERQNAFLAAHGYCFWVVEHQGGFAGWCGLKPGGVPSIADEVEVGWTMHPDLWGRGLATEAAAAALAFAWERTEAPAVVAITAAINRRSLAVMARLGMTPRAGGTFDHPALPADHSLRRHVTFEVGRPDRG